MLLESFLFLLRSPFGAAVVFFYGTVLGSFATLLVYRLPRGLPWGMVRSQCPKCTHVLGAFELVPLFSWLWQGGKCKQCRAPISYRYPLIEAGFGVAALALWWGLT